jgi:hypothetical protein
MKGPSDISDILSGLKTKTIDISPPIQKKSDTIIDAIRNSEEWKDLKMTEMLMDNDFLSWFSGSRGCIDFLFHDLPRHATHGKPESLGKGNC